MEIQLEGAELHVAGQNLIEIPTFLMENYGSVVRCLDLSFNNIKHLSNLDGFFKLESLVVDNNELVSQQNLPKLESLHILSVNSNMIDDLEVFLNCVAVSCPNLTFLSLWKNECCPNEMVGKDSDDYKRYRYYVLHRIPTLRYLDSTAITPEERREAKRVGALMRIAKPKTPPESQQNDQEDPGYAALPEADDSTGAAGASRFGRSKYVYYGKQSEGNRFILNEDL